MAKQPETVVITPHDLPLHCNGPQEQAWNGHPRVFLPIKSFSEIECPYRVTKTMASTVAACLATPFKIKGVNYSISSACSTSAHCIGHAAELIQLDKQDIVFAGGGEEVS